MELKEFIKTAITDITEAVSELQDGLQNGAVVNPTLSQGENGKALLISLPRREEYQRQYEFLRVVLEVLDEQ